MKPDARFLEQERHFWANVRTISERIGYTERKTKKNKEPRIKIPSLPAIIEALRKNNLGANHLLTPNGKPNELGETLLAYFEYRADVLNNRVTNWLMDVDEAKAIYDGLRIKYPSKVQTPMNKQTGDKRAPAYFTGIINTLIEANIGNLRCQYSPQGLTAVTRDGAPLRTLSRRVDGAFPDIVNPVAIWEIKEYYYTKTFGSRVADAIYETQLDGMEIAELHDHVKLRQYVGSEILHYLMIDARFAWWNLGRSYLCRIIDLLHMGYIDEALFGREAVERIPELAKEWVAIAQERSSS